MAEVSATLSVKEGSKSSNNLPSAEELHGEFHHILMLLNFATPFNHGHSMLHDVTYKARFDRDRDAEYGRLSQAGLLNMLAVLLGLRRLRKSLLWWTLSPLMQ